MFGDVGDPLTVGCVGGEITAQVVVVHRRARPLARAAFAHGCRPQFLLGAQPPHAAFPDDDAGAFEFIGQQPVAERRIGGVGVDQGVDRVRVVPVPVGDRLGAPGVVGLGGEAEHPAGQPDREPLCGQVTDQREHHFGRVEAAK